MIIVKTTYWVVRRELLVSVAELCVVPCRWSSCGVDSAETTEPWPASAAWLAVDGGQALGLSTGPAASSSIGVWPHHSCCSCCYCCCTALSYVIVIRSISAVIIFCCINAIKGKGIALNRKKPLQSYGASPTIWDHTVLAATEHRWTPSVLTPARQAVTGFTYLGRKKGWVHLGGSYILRWFTCPQTVTHSSSNHLIATRPEIESTTLRSQVWYPSVTPPSHPHFLTRLIRHYIVSVYFSLLFTSAKEVMFLPVFVCLSVC